MFCRNLAICLAAAIAAAIAGPLAAQTLRVENRMDVVPTASGFEVMGDGGLGARGMWCAAATYARDVAGARSAQQIYVAQGRVPGLGQRDGVVFTLDPSGLQPTPVVIVGASLRRAGATLSVGHAITFCADFRLQKS